MYTADSQVASLPMMLRRFVNRLPDASSPSATLPTPIISNRAMTDTTKKRRGDAASESRGAEVKRNRGEERRPNSSHGSSAPRILCPSALFAASLFTVANLTISQQANSAKATERNIGNSTAAAAAI